MPLRWMKAKLVNYGRIIMRKNLSNNFYISQTSMFRDSTWSTCWRDNACTMRMIRATTTLLGVHAVHNIHGVVVCTTQYILYSTQSWFNKHVRSWLGAVTWATGFGLLVGVRKQNRSEKMCYLKPLKNVLPLTF